MRNIEKKGNEVKITTTREEVVDERVLSVETIQKRIKDIDASIKKLQDEKKEWKDAIK